MAASGDSLRTALQEYYAPTTARLFGKQPSAETDSNLVLANFGKVMEAFLRTRIRSPRPSTTSCGAFEAARSSTSAPATTRPRQGEKCTSASKVFGAQGATAFSVTGARCSARRLPQHRG